MDVIWLKRDVRLHDHGPLHFVCTNPSKFRICILYLYEPNQLCEPTVHGSRIALINEGLVDFDQQLSALDDNTTEKATPEDSTESSTLVFQYLTVCHGNAVPVLDHIHSTYTIRRLLAHEETGHYASYQRDRKLKEFLDQPKATVNITDNIMKSQIRQLTLECHEEDPTSDDFFRVTRYPLLEQLLVQEIPAEHRIDRPRRQRGGERVESATKARSEALKQQSPDTGSFRTSLAAFQSRLHWRSHFIQKLETDPLLEKRDLHTSYQTLRRQPGDWNDAHYQAWATGNTGFSFVDACTGTRCLRQTGWINFRMRAMLVSFGTYNLWLDWKRIAPHPARVFADYEPGIHYPQLQMQAGTTGINAMRVYNVVKQGKDQDPEGVFVKRYLPDLQHVPKKYIREPWNMPKTTKQQCKVKVVVLGQPNSTGSDNESSDTDDVQSYPLKIVDPKESAKVAKSKVHNIRKQEETQKLAQEVYLKHGSRSRRDSIPMMKNPKRNRLLPKINQEFDHSLSNNKHNQQPDQTQQNHHWWGARGRQQQNNCLKGMH
ncbi:Cryptochrome-like protein cry2 [Seminavis robusta]|uniref:Cryptochrome-like protein cry2 n=1 Tax=Seminavis robusta TaxID=568900 RepID=A0A9N8F2G9_9STRA|nr:Cryptochrome-like protein cry2 [Seminavis robusta]|eukprot:Sro2822_g337960.1 Cryptochrome-like protein cry2 (544) ;mRNA; f:1470-3318